MLFDVFSRYALFPLRFSIPIGYAHVILSLRRYHVEGLKNFCEYWKIGEGDIGLALVAGQPRVFPCCICRVMGEFTRSWL